MSVTDVITDISNNTTKVNAEKAKTRMGESTMDQDAFLQLLMMQMKSQDPTNPMGNSEFISQTAQFTQISELQKLNKSVANSNQIMQSSALIGREVTLTDPDNAENKITGIVTEALFSENGAAIRVNGKQYPVDTIESVRPVIYIPDNGDATADADTSTDTSADSNADNNATT